MPLTPELLEPLEICLASYFYFSATEPIKMSLTVPEDLVC